MHGTCIKITCVCVVQDCALRYIRINHLKVQQTNHGFPDNSNDTFYLLTNNIPLYHSTTQRNKYCHYQLTLLALDNTYRCGQQGNMTRQPP
jgi:hypothetical protein